METPTKRGDELEIGPELGGLMGLRAIKIDPLESMGFKIAEYQTGIRNARREFTGGYFGLLRGGPLKLMILLKDSLNQTKQDLMYKKKCIEI